MKFQQTSSSTRVLGTHGAGRSGWPGDDIQEAMYCREHRIPDRLGAPLPRGRGRDDEHGKSMID